MRMDFELARIDIENKIINDFSKLTIHWVHGMF